MSALRGTLSWSCRLQVCNLQLRSKAENLSRIGYQKREKSCKNLVKAEDDKVEVCTKADPPAKWKIDCHKGPQPFNYDPYRIKVPNFVVPPLVTPTNVKWTDTVPTNRGDQEKSSIQRQQDSATNKQKYEPQNENGEESGGLFGYLKKWFREKRKGSTENRMTKVQLFWLPVVDCMKCKGPCTPQHVTPLPPCLPPPSKPFPWKYIWPPFLFFAAMGIVYKMILLKDSWDKEVDAKTIWRPRKKQKVPVFSSDLPDCVQYLIVGAGAAAWGAYESIMERDKTAKVLFLTNEDVFPYERPPMSKTLWLNEQPPDPTAPETMNYVVDGRKYSLYSTEPANFMEMSKFNSLVSGPAAAVASGWCARRVDPDEHVVWVQTHEGEKPIYYQRCLLAPGAAPATLDVFTSAPRAVRSRVTTLRTLRDLETAHRRVRDAGHVTVVGGGTLGSELAYHLAQMKKVLDRPALEVAHVVRERGILASIVPPYLAEWATEKLRAQGVTCTRESQVYDAYETPDGRLELTLSNGDHIVTDFVFVCVGARPRSELAARSGLELDDVNGGILVNAELEARKHLYVAGDAASFYSVASGARTRHAHYESALRQGRVAGANMAGCWTPCQVHDTFHVNLGPDVQMEAVGEVNACMPTVALFKQCGDEPAAGTQRDQPANSSQHDQPAGTQRDQPASAQPDQAGEERPCYKKTNEYQGRYKRGLVFYLRGETVAGVVCWNIPAVADRADVIAEMLRARPSYRDISSLADALGFTEARCSYEQQSAAAAPLHQHDAGPCISNFKEW